MNLLFVLIAPLVIVATLAVYGACWIAKDREQRETHNHLRDPQTTAAIRREILRKMEARLR